MKALIRILGTAAAFLTLSCCGISNKPQPPQPPKPDTLTVFVIGDVMMHSPQLRHDCHNFFKHICKPLAEADIAIANMEFSLGGKPYTGYPQFSAPDYYAEYMAEIGTDVFLTANNHILDRGSKGLTRTLDFYRSMKDSVLFTGSAASELERDETYPLIIDAKGIRLAIVNFTYGTNGIFVEGWPNANYMDSTEVKAAIGRAKDKDADFIIAMPHWGEEYNMIHSREQERWAEWLVEQGCDLIIGGHPHSVQDSTHIGRVPVIYSIGNAVSNQSQHETQIELAATLRFVKWGSRSIMLEPELRYMWCSRPAGLGASYHTIFVDEWLDRRDQWQNPADYDRMVSIWEKVKKKTGVKYEENDHTGVD